MSRVDGYPNPPGQGESAAETRPQAQTETPHDEGVPSPLLVGLPRRPPHDVRPHDRRARDHLPADPAAEDLAADPVDLPLRPARQAARLAPRGREPNGRPAV